MKTIGFIIPVYNEQDRIENTFRALTGFYEPRGLKLSQIIFVNDGSADSTLKLLKDFKKRIKNSQVNVDIVSYPVNKGKGFAVKKGLARVSTDYTLLFDADMSTPLSELSKFVSHIENGGQITIGTRKNGKSTVVKHQPLYREALGKGFTLLTQILLRVKTTDFTCGFKLFSKEAAHLLSKELVIERWGYDAEMIVIAKKHNITVREIPVLWTNDERTKVVLFKAVPQSLYELLVIIYHHELKNISLHIPTLSPQFRSISSRLVSLFA